MLLCLSPNTDLLGYVDNNQFIRQLNIKQKLHRIGQKYRQCFLEEEKQNQKQVSFTKQNLGEKKRQPVQIYPICQYLI